MSRKVKRIKNGKKSNAVYCFVVQKRSLNSIKNFIHTKKIFKQNEAKKNFA